MATLILLAAVATRLRSSQGARGSSLLSSPSALRTWSRSVPPVRVSPLTESSCVVIWPSVAEQDEELSITETVRPVS